jgi:hypothetical protein
MTKTFLGFRNGKLITVVESTIDNFESAVDVDYIVANPQDAEKQITEWKKQNSS